MNSDSGNSIWNFAGSVGWLIDRAHDDQEQVLGTVWLAGSRAAVTCALTVVPYEEIYNALIVRFPLTNEAYSVRDVEFHPGFDRWFAKRALAKASFYPPPILSSQQQNLAMLQLGDQIRQLDEREISRINQQLARVITLGEAGFSGRASNVELTGILQTLVNARREGTIVICDPRKRPIARMFCEDGRIAYARYHDSTNELAVFRLICSYFNGYFYFQPESLPEWADFAPMTKPAASLLMEAYRRLEEMTQVVEAIGGTDAVLHKSKHEPNFQNMPYEVKEDAKAVWAYIHDGMPLLRLLKVCNLDGYVVTRVVQELVTYGHLSVYSGYETPALASYSQPLPMAAQAPLSPGDEIAALAMDPETSMPFVAAGKILRARHRGDPWHQVHTIALYDESLGCPIFNKEGAVVGMYCGNLMPEQNEPAEFAYAQQMLWVASVNTCLQQLPSGQPVQVPRSTTTTTTTGENVVIEIEDDELTLSPEPPKAKPAVEVVPQEEPKHAIPSLLGSLSAVFQPFSRRNHSQPTWFEIELSKAECGSVQWSRATNATAFRTGDLMRLQIKPLKDCCLYAIYQPGSTKQFELLYPDIQHLQEVHAANSTLVIPSKQGDHAMTNRTSSGRYSLLGLPITGAPGGTDSLLLIGSHAPLSLLGNKLNWQLIFTKCMIMLNGHKNLEVLETSEKILNEAIGAPVNAGDNPIAISKLRISHQN